MPPVLGSLACICATVAPAFAESIAAYAISLGVTGTCGLLEAVSPAPVTAAVNNILFTLILLSKLHFIYHPDGIDT